MKPGEVQAQESEGAFGKVDGADEEGQGGVNEGQRNTENSQEASGNVAPLEINQIPVQPGLESQTEQEGEDEQRHCVRAGVTLASAGAKEEAKNRCTVALTVLEAGQCLFVTAFTKCPSFTSPGSDIQFQLSPTSTLYDRCVQIKGQQFSLHFLKCTLDFITAHVSSNIPN